MDGLLLVDWARYIIPLTGDTDTNILMTLQQTMIYNPVKLGRKEML